MYLKLWINSNILMFYGLTSLCTLQWSNVYIKGCLKYEFKPTFFEWTSLPLTVTSNHPVAPGVPSPDWIKYII